jgi:hypothetical protein
MGLFQPFPSLKQPPRPDECSSQSQRTLSPRKDHNRIWRLLLALQGEIMRMGMRMKHNQEHKNLQQLKNETLQGANYF